jgi:hypothetical protein
MDAHEQLAFESEVCFAVLGALGTSGEFVLVDLAQERDNVLIKEAQASGWAYCGAIGLKDGNASAVCESHPATWRIMTNAALAAARMLAPRLRTTAPTKGDAVEWLRKLADLPDTRKALGGGSMPR